MDHLISIIMPVKNAGLYISNCFESIQNQNYPCWELIVIDDHSTDNSLRIIQDFSHTDARIKFFKNSEKGIIPALQLGIKNTHGEFISRMDADDIMPPDRLMRMATLLEKSPPKTIVSGLVKYFGDKPISLGYKTYEHWINQLIADNSHWKNIYRECVIASPNWLGRTSEFKELKLMENLNYPEDYDLVFKWYQSGFTVKTVKQTTLLWREHPQRTSRNSDRYQQQSFFNLKIRRFIDLDYTTNDLVLWGVGEKARLTANILQTKKIPFHWMAMDPEKYPNGIQGKTVVDFKNINKLKDPQLLIAIYPEQNVRLKIEAYLYSYGLEEGKTFWYL